MGSYVLGFQEINKTKIMVVGGKGANLGELSILPGICVPEGFCVTTKAFLRVIGETSQVIELLDQLTQLKLEDRDKIGVVSSELRRVIEGIVIPEDIKEQITGYLKRLGEKDAYAVRSSATAEDLPSASFAGQQDTYLNIIGIEAILEHISKCFASLFTERAVTYRLQNGFDHRKVQLAVVIQRMVFPQAAGIMFTADPITSNRKVVSIDAGFGLGEALVSGLVNADNIKVRGGKIIDKKISTKKLAIYASNNGGTKEQEIPPEQQTSQVLTEEQILSLAHMGRMIEEHFGCPQDIEWCLSEDNFYIVQSRPITTLFPIPEENDDDNHVYVSVGHQQMMTDPIKPLGLSFYLLTSFAPMKNAGGRLFVDVAPMLAFTDSRQSLLNTLGGSDPLIKDALMTIIERDYIKSLPNDKEATSQGSRNKDVTPLDPALVSDLMEAGQKSIEELSYHIQMKSGPELFDFILEDLKELKKLLFDPRSMAVIMAAMNAYSWINDKMNLWLGEKNIADILAGSVPNNITSEMGLELLNVADVLRPYPEVIDYLQQVKEENFLEELSRFEGGQKVQAAIRAYLKKYGMRCVGEIDITRTRWSEKPSTLIPLLLNNIKNFEPGAGVRKFENGRIAALNKEEELLERLKLLVEGEQKVIETKQKISLIRNFSGYREYPKYGMISRYFLYKQSLQKEAVELVKAGVIHEKDEIYYLTFEELREVVRTQKLDHSIISKRKEEYSLYERLTPPRVITSDGEIITGKYNRDHLPAEAIVGLPVSSGSVEGRARVILKLEDAILEEGDILVTSYTDPSWTPLFVSVKGLITEVGGLMTHGAVIAREYGIPAIVGVENATRLIKDGQRIRVNGTEGYVEVIS